MRRYKIFLIFVILPVIFIWAFLFFSGPAQAAIVPCGTTGTNECRICDLVLMGKNIIDFVLTILTPAIATLLYLFAGFMIVLGGASPGQIATGKKIFWNTTIGLFIIFGSWIITNTILVSLAGDSNVSGTWYKIECEEVGPSVIPPPPGQKYSCNSSKQCVPDSAGQYSTLSSCQNACQPVSIGNCTGKSCNYNSHPDTVSCSPVAPAGGCGYINSSDINTAISSVSGKSICSGVDTTKMLKALVAMESGGKIDAASGMNAYGAFQLLVDTANAFKTNCGVSSGTNITSAWLKDANNLSSQACIAAEYLKSLVGACGCNPIQLAAGYNGGGAGEGACETSANCGPSAGSGECSMCGGGLVTKKWQCLWDDNAHSVCNSDKSGGGFASTRVFAPKIGYCYNQ